MFCQKCGKEITGGESFCPHCGEKVVPIAEQTINGASVEKLESVEIPKQDDAVLAETEYEKNRKRISNAGNIVQVFGWLKIALSLPIYMLLKTSSDYQRYEYDLPNVIMAFSTGFLLVILGGRIKSQDINTRKYIIILLSVLIPFMLLGIIFTGRISSEWVNIVIIGYLVPALFAIKRLLKIQQYRDSLSKPDYQMKGYHWIIFVVASFVLFTLACILDAQHPIF